MIRSNAKGDEFRKAKSILPVIFLSILMMEAVSLASSGATLYLPLIVKPFSRPGFGVLETSHGLIIYQEGVALTAAQEAGMVFENAYQVVGQDLGYPDLKPRLYVYRSLDDLLNDLINTWHYPEWFRTIQAFPRMNKDYEAWIPPNVEVGFIGHEYSHRIIEKIAGLNSQTKYKWFDEGLAEHEKLRTWAVRSPLEAETARQNYWNQVKTGFQSGQWIALQALTTESQWTAQMATPAMNVPPPGRVNHPEGGVPFSSFRICDWTPAFPGVTTFSGLPLGVIPAKAGIQTS